MTYRSAGQLIKDLQEKRTSSTELVEQAISRIEQHDEKLNAVVVRDFDRALDAAKAADADIANGTKKPLLGLPMTVKESFDVTGLPTTWGLEGHEANIADKDAVTVKRLKDAGAIILGKTNVPVQLSDWQSYNPVYGTSNNPWNLDRTPGGSSGGAAAALAAGYTSLELGSDIGGSLRIPASYCGICAHKPSFNLVPKRGHKHPLTPNLTIDLSTDLSVAGPMARTAEDLMLELDIIAGPDDADATAYQLNLPAPRHNTLQDHRILLLDEHPLIPTSDDVRKLIQSFGEKLEKVGCKVDRSGTDLPDLSQVGILYMKMLMSVFSADLPQPVYDRTVERANSLDDQQQDLAAAVVRGVATTHRDWIHNDRQRTLISNQLRQFFNNYDVIICPVSSTAAMQHDHTEQTKRTLTINGQETTYNYQSMWISLATLTGLPATAIPIGKSNEDLPVGAQIIGPYLEDRTSINFAALAEREFGGFVQPEGY